MLHRKTLIAAHLVLATAFAHAQSSRHIIFASPAGKTDAMGSSSQPTTFIEAIARAANPKIKEIVLLDGEYRLESTLELSLRRSPETALTIRANSPGKAILSGGHPLKDFRRLKEQHVAFAIPSDTGLRKSRDLFLGETRAVRARSIEYIDWKPTFSAIPGLARIDPEPSSDVAISQDFYLVDHSGKLPPLNEWSKPSDLEFVFRCAWWEKRCGVRSVTADRIQLGEPGWSAINTPWGDEETSRLNAAMPKSTFLEGAYELLDSPGEWFHGGDEIHLILPASLSPRLPDVRLARLQTLLRIKGSANLTFSGLSFKHTTWHLSVHSTGFNEGQANFEQIGNVGHPSTAVEVLDSERINVHSCSFSQLGGWGVRIFERSQDVALSRCQFLDIAGSAIVIGSIQEEHALDASLQTRRVSVTGSWIHEPASVYRGGVGIFVGYASDVILRDNEICHAPYTGISVGWGWNQLDGKPTQITGNKVIGNYIHNYLQEMYDGGGIYTLGPQGDPREGLKRGAVIAANTITRQSGLGNVIYSDSGSRWATITDNHSFDNLRELDHYYEGRSRYVSDWGGCSPFGDLVFVNNILGNAPNKFPNFRCDPSDPAPWVKELTLPINTRTDGNTFHLRGEPGAETEILSKLRHHELTQSSDEIEISFIPLFDDSSVLEFSLSGPTQLSLGRDGVHGVTSRNIHLLDHEGTLVSSWKADSQVVQLQAGDFKLLLADGANSFRNERWRLSLRPSALRRIELPAIRAEINLQSLNETRILVYPESEPWEGELRLLAGDGTIIERNRNWLDSAYNWKVLRYIINAQAKLPSRSPAILRGLPGGQYTIELEATSAHPNLRVFFEN